MGIESSYLGIASQGARRPADIDEPEHLIHIARTRAAVQERYVDLTVLAHGRSGGLWLAGEGGKSGDRLRRGSMPDQAEHGDGHTRDRHYDDARNGD